MRTSEDRYLLLVGGKNKLGILVSSLQFKLEYWGIKCLVQKTRIVRRYAYRTCIDVAGSSLQGESHKSCFGSCG